MDYEQIEYLENQPQPNQRVILSLLLEAATAQFPGSKYDRPSAQVQRTNR
jgi:hypothetical protein